MNGEQALALYEKTREKKVTDAITVFTFNTKLFPNSGNMFDSLGEAYYV